MGGLQLDEVKTVPPWVSFFSLDAWRALLVAIQEDLQRRRVAARYAGDHFSAAFPDGRLARLAIVNLAERCRDAPIEDFPVYARAHFDAVIGPLQEAAEAPNTPESFDGIAPSLIVHLYREDMVKSSRGALVERPVCPGLVSALALDFGHAIGSISREITDAWQRPDDELFRIGMNNIQKRAVTREALPFPGLPGIVLSGTDYTVTSQIFFLGNHLGRHFPAGALVALPTRNTLLCVALQTCDALGSVERIASTIGLVHDLFDDLAGRVTNAEQMFSPHLYWWRDGAIRELRAAMTPHGPLIAPPQEFLDTVLSQRALYDD